MVKKSLIAIFIFSLLTLASSTIFASNMMDGAGNTLNNIKTGVQNMMSDAGNAMEGAKDGISNMARNGEKDVKNGTEDVSRGMSDNGYTATRTSTTTGTTNNGRNLMVWLILAFVTAAIVALVWYYGRQVENRD